MNDRFTGIIRSKVVQRTLGVLLICIGSYFAWKMYTHPLWGWWPLWMMLSFWVGGMLIFFPKQPDKIRWLGLSTLAGIMLGLGFPPSPLTWLVFVAWIPLLAMEADIYKRDQRTKPGRIFLYSFNAFVLWNVIATFWVMNTAFFAGIVANYLNAAIMAGVFAGIHVITRRYLSKFSAIVFIACWISFEYLHHFWDISWPWLTHGNALSEYPGAIQWYEYIGAFGGSLWVLAVNVTGYHLYQRRKNIPRSLVFAWAGLIIIPVLISLWIGGNTKEGDSQPIEVAIIQPNYEPHYEKFTIPERVQSKRFVDLSFGALTSSTEYLVYPETSFDRIRLNAFRENPVINMCQSLVDSFPNLRLISGIASYRFLEESELEGTSYRIHVNAQGDTTFWDIQNSAMQLTSGEEDYDIYFKSKLVPGPEMFPFRKVLFFLKPLIDKLGGTQEGHTKQKTRDVFSGGSLSVAPVICYESIYGDYTGGYVRNGANALFIVTNDGWWDNTPGHIQHLKLGTLRAIEHRRPIARSANTGISCFIDIKGNILQPTQYDEATFITGSLIPETRMTFYTRWGDLVAKLAVLLTAACLVFVLFRLGTRLSAPSTPIKE